MLYGYKKFAMDANKSKDRLRNRVLAGTLAALLVTTATSDVNAMRAEQMSPVAQTKPSSDLVHLYSPLSACNAPENFTVKTLIEYGDFPRLIMLNFDIHKDWTTAFEKLEITEERFPMLKLLGCDMNRIGFMRRDLDGLPLSYDVEIAHGGLEAAVITFANSVSIKRPCLNLSTLKIALPKQPVMLDGTLFPKLEALEIWGSPGIGFVLRHSFDSVKALRLCTATYRGIMQFGSISSFFPNLEAIGFPIQDCLSDASLSITNAETLKRIVFRSDIADFLGGCDNK